MLVIELNCSIGNRHVTNPRALAEILQNAEQYLAETRHPDPYICMYSLGLLAVNSHGTTSTECPWRDKMVSFSAISDVSR
jgi:hypothetical protein